MEEISDQSAHRIFSKDEESTYASADVESSVADVSIIAALRQGIIGDNEAIPTPLGPRKITYVDHTASGRAVGFIEDYMRDAVLPLYANTHTTTSECGWQSHMFLSEARDIVRDAVNASEKDDVVLFTGRGATAASNMLAHFALGSISNRSSASTSLRCSFPGCDRSFQNKVDLHMHGRTHPDGEQIAWQKAPLPKSSERKVEEEKEYSDDTASKMHTTIVLIGPYAHHSSILPFSERGAEIRFVASNKETGDVDYAHLYERLTTAIAETPHVFAVFTAVSNITGAAVNTKTATAMCKFFRVPCFWDFAASAPHTGLNMNRKEAVTWEDLCAVFSKTKLQHPHPTLSSVDTSFDAAYFSMHKFVGGPGAQGVLVVKRRLFKSVVPHLPGGGTVFFVQPDGTPRYLANDAEREEGGSPDLIGAVRAGLAFHLFRTVGSDVVRTREAQMAQVARHRLQQHTNIRLLEAPSSSETPIISFVVVPPVLRGITPSETSTTHVLHWGFVTAVLNDVFGIQSRGGCLCAGPYGMELLGIDAEDAIKLEAALLHKNELLRPGVVRISFAYYMSHAAFQYVLKAVEWVASFGHNLLHLYVPVHDTGEWRINRAQAASFLTDGYRLKDQIDAGIANESTSVFPGVVEWLRSMHHKVGEQACREFIFSLTIGDGAGHLQQAQRGGTRTHPRRWLQDLKIGAEGARWPRHAVRLDMSKIQEADIEYELYDSYLAEACLLLGGILMRPIPASPHHEPKSLLTSDSQSLRWFTCANDFEGPPSSLVHLPVFNFSRTLTPSKSAELSSSSTISADRLPPEQRLRWDGAAIAVPSEIENANRGPSTTTKPPKRVAEKERVRPFQEVKRAVLPIAIPLATPTAPETPTSETCTVSEAPAAQPAVLSHAHKRPGYRATMSEDAYRARAERFKQTKNALAMLPSGPSPLTDQMKRSIIKAMQDFAMIKDGDKLLVGLSGGKDSLSLLILLLMLQERSPVRYEVAACTVDPMYAGFDPSPLKHFLKKLGVPYYYASEPVIDMAATYMDRDSICAWCSRMKRGILYTTARANGYNVLVLGQHLDDFAESFVMSAFRNGALRTMKANYMNDAGDVRIIRPLAYVRERQTREFALAMKLPIINENCPACFSGPTERYHVKKVLATEESTNPVLFTSLCTAMKPLMTDEGARVVRNMSLTAEDAVSSSRSSRAMTSFLGIGASIASMIGEANAALRGDAGNDDSEEEGEDASNSTSFRLPPKPCIVNLTAEDPEPTFASPAMAARGQVEETESAELDQPPLALFDTDDI